MFWFGLYLVVGFVLLLAVRGYEHFPPPSRLVQQPDGGYKFKDYIEMPEWLWFIMLTVLWLPYIVVLFIDIRNNLHP